VDAAAAHHRSGYRRRRRARAQSVTVSARRTAFSSLIGAALLLGGAAAPRAQSADAGVQPPAPPPAPTPAPAPASPAEVPAESTGPAKPAKYPWLDDVHDFLYDAAWHTAERVDRLFGSEEPDAAYEQASGSLAPALLYDRYDGWHTLLRFIGDLPLPQLSESFHAFIGRLNPEEFISESQAPSGAFPNPYAPYPQDQTLLGIQYYQPECQGAQWDAGLGLPVTASRFDPYVKGGYLYQLGDQEHGVLQWRQDLFYQDSQGGFGVTNRLDLQRLMSARLLLTWTGSTTIAQRSYGWRSYSTVDAYLAFPDRRAVIGELEVDGTTRAPVPLHDFGVKVAYRRSILRDWLVLEVRTSLDFPKNYVYETRQPSWGLGVGFEMTFGTDVFLARPITF
jgi:hypothetical protein